MSILKKNLFLEKDIYNNNKLEIEDKNNRMLITCSIIGICVFLFLFLISLDIESYYDLTLPYLILVFFTLILLFLGIYLKNKISSLFLLYVSYTFFIIYCIYTSSFILTEEISVFILSFIFIIPVITLDKSYRINLITIFYSLSYLCFVFYFKNNDKDLLIDEFVNIITFTITSIFLGQYLRKTRIENLELRRLGVIRETTDDLTGLYNRRKLFSELKLLSDHSNHKEVAALAIIDVDKFKCYNDVYGHLAGDDCLVKISQAFKEVSKKYNITFYRYGGEEFIAIIYNNKNSVPAHICQDINETIYKLAIPHKGTSIGVVTVSVGITIAPKEDVICFETLISQADEALYWAKGNGRNKTVFYTSSCDNP